MARRSTVTKIGTNSVRVTAEHVGHCAVCKCGIFTNQEWGRAPKPLLGKAHEWCGGVRT